MIILEGGMEPLKVPVFAKEGHRLGLNGPVRPKGRQKEVGGGRTLQPSGPGSMCQVQSLLLAFAHALFPVRNTFPATSPSSLLLSLRSQFRQWHLLQGAILDLPPPSSTHTRAGAPLGFPQCAEAPPLQLCSS